MSNSIAGTGSGGKSVPVKITVEHLDEQPIPVNQDELWKVAKNMVHESSMHAYISDLALDKLKQHFTLQLKSSPSPTPVNERAEKYYVLYESDSTSSKTCSFIADSLQDCYNQFEGRFGIPAKQIINIHTEPIHPAKPAVQEGLREDNEINNYYMNLFEGEADHHASNFHSIEDYDRVYRAVLHGCKFGFQERQKEIDVLDKAHDTTIEQLRMAQDERNKWKEMYESLTTTPTPIHDPEICGCGSHSDYCPYNPDASEVPENEKKLPKTSTIKTLINELFELMPAHINPYNLGEMGRINAIIHKLKKLSNHDSTPVQEGLREIDYNANFLWGFPDDSIEAMGYEFANAKTEAYQKECWNSLIEKLTHQREDEKENQGN